MYCVQPVILLCLTRWQSTIIPYLQVVRNVVSYNVSYAPRDFSFGSARWLPTFSFEPSAHKRQHLQLYTCSIITTRRSDEYQQVGCHGAYGTAPAHKHERESFYQDPYPEDKCPTLCERDLSPVCGSNNVTYANECMLEVAHCLDPKINRLGRGRCHKWEVKRRCSRRLISPTVESNVNVWSDLDISPVWLSLLSRGTSARHELRRWVSFICLRPVKWSVVLR